MLFSCLASFLLASPQFLKMGNTQLYLLFGPIIISDYLGCFEIPLKAPKI